MLAVTQAFLPLLGARVGARHAPGRVINLSSISGGMALPLVALYAMTKHAVEALCDGMRRELSIYGICVSALEPGPIKTPIWDKIPQQQAGGRYADTDYAAAMDALPAYAAKELKSAKPMHVVTDAICHTLEAAQPRPRYPLMRMWYLRNFIPDRLLDRLTIRLAGLKPVR